MPGPMKRTLWLGDLICGSRMGRELTARPFEVPPEFSLHVKAHIILGLSLGLILQGVSLPSGLPLAHLPNNIYISLFAHGLLLGETELRQPDVDIRHALLPEHLHSDQ